MAAYPLNVHSTHQFLAFTHTNTIMSSTKTTYIDAEKHEARAKKAGRKYSVISKTLNVKLDNTNYNKVGCEKTTNEGKISA